MKLQVQPRQQLLRSYVRRRLAYIMPILLRQGYARTDRRFVHLCTADQCPIGMDSLSPRPTLIFHLSSPLLPSLPSRHPARLSPRAVWKEKKGFQECLPPTLSRQYNCRGSDNKERRAPFYKVGQQIYDQDYVDHTKVLGYNCRIKWAKTTKHTSHSHDST